VPPSDLKEMLNDAFGIGLTQGRVLPAHGDVVDAARRLGRVVPEPLLDERARWRLAVHEAGHCGVVARLLGGDRILQVTLDGSGGHTQLSEAGGHSDEYELHKQAAVGFGGILAEELLLSSVDIGAAHDISQVTSLARGLAAFGRLPHFPPVDAGLLDPMSAGLNDRYDRAVVLFAEEAREEAQRILINQTGAIERFALRLIDSGGSLHGPTLIAALNFADFRLPDLTGEER
jgi:cell division protease FtsH